MNWSFGIFKLRISLIFQKFLLAKHFKNLCLYYYIFNLSWCFLCCFTILFLFVLFIKYLKLLKDNYIPLRVTMLNKNILNENKYYSLRKILLMLKHTDLLYIYNFVIMNIFNFRSKIQKLNPGKCTKYFTVWPNGGNWD